MVIQSVIFDKKHWTVESSRRWLEHKHLKDYKVHITDNFIRWRQHEPDQYSKYITKRLPNGIEYILNY